MKVVLFCGGLGTRLREYSDTIPKPMVPIGTRPILWHVMKYYSYFGHTEFILCLGYKGDMIKEYFLNYDECLSNNFVLHGADRRIELYSSDIEDWKITFVDTGLNANIGQRLVMVRDYLGDDDFFLANYADGLTNVDLVAQVDELQRLDKVASFLCIQPVHSFHVAAVDDNNLVTAMHPIGRSGLWINGGYFVLRKDIFDYIAPGEELVMEPFQRLLAQQKLIGHVHDGFWACMDTFKDKQMFDTMHASGDMPWTFGGKINGA